MFNPLESILMISFMQLFMIHHLISLRFSSHIEAFASGLLENLEEMLCWSYMYSYMLSRLKSSIAL